MSAKRSIWAVAGKILWAFFSLVLRIAAALGFRWARKRLDKHRDETSANPVRRALGRRRS